MRGSLEWLEKRSAKSPEKVEIIQAPMDITKIVLIDATVIGNLLVNV